MNMRKLITDPIDWMEYSMNREEMGLPIEEEETIPIKLGKSIEPDWKKILDPIEYFEYVSMKEQLQGGYKINETKN